MGLREIFYYDNDETICISTRSCLFKQIFNLTLSEAYLAGQWLTTCPPYYSTPYNEIERLKPGSTLVVDREHRVNVTNSKLTLIDGGVAEIKQQLKKFTLLRYPGKNTSLGLSGGLDSRTLLAINYFNETESFFTHTFGSENLSDVIIAKQIAETFKLKHMQYYSKSISVDSTLNLIKTYLPFTGLTVPISDLIHIDFHRKIYEAGLSYTRRWIW
ncbi:MAG: hypothetical protein U5K00_09665 [Melioribacteraceae bacterium]|nr:hypothetical protein [Melioribacteraceae bacterium]